MAQEDHDNKSTGSDDYGEESMVDLEEELISALKKLIDSDLKTES